MKKLVLCTTLILFLVAVAAYAMNVPNATNYQGRLTDDNGDPVPDGTYNISLNIYHMESGGSPVYTETESVQVTNGLFNCILYIPDYALTDTSFCYLGITVNGEEILPRTMILSSAFAMHAQHGGGWKFNQGGYLSNTIHTDETVEYMKVGINNPNPEEELTIGSQNLGTFFGNCISISSPDSNSGFLIGKDMSNRVAIFRSVDGRFLINTVQGGEYYYPVRINQDKVGIDTWPDDPSEPLVVGKDLGSFSGDRIVIGDDAAGAQTGLVFGESGSDRAWMLWDVDEDMVTLGSKHSGTNYSDALTIQNGCVGLGIEPQTYTVLRIDRTYNSSLSRYASIAQAVQGGTGSAFGMWSKAQRTSSSSTSNYTYGVYGIGQNDFSVGSAVGVYGYATGGDFTRGVMADVPGYHEDLDNAGYFLGDVAIQGEIVYLFGAYRVDHPLDPENKYLYHSNVGSPDMMNVYTGNVVTDASGQATVNLPEYFEHLNSDFRYQLTVIGTFAQAIVKEEISNNSFVIATSEPNVKVSWTVTGIRNDPYANARRIVPEREKHVLERGTYLFPQGFGLGEERSVDYNSRQAAREAAEAGGEEQ
ncbi:MAG TPA: hypothetical protein ENO22_05335 [candidate division Zixibacteria bacterium]|nr:hypothetical protein [candidate division Zixibacteria bacterium]HEQ98747.1 hypothetical protein [candidate division Zixibacteria bacterium]